MNRKDSVNKMVSAAQLYYLYSLPRSEIAKRMGISRQTVSTLLVRAQEEGLIEINIIDPFNFDNQLGKSLCALTGLKDVVVTQAPKTQSNYIKRNIGLAGADYLQKKMAPGNVIGLGWGETVSNMIKSLPRTNIANTTVVPMMGGEGRIDPEFQVNNLTMLFSQKIGSSPLQLYTPTVFESEAIYTSMVESVSSVIRYWDKMDVAVVGIGIVGMDTAYDNIHKNNISYSERIKMEELGAVGDIGLYYFDISGNPVVINNIYKISMGLEKIRKVPLVIGLAGGLDKLNAIQGAITGHYINVLITDEYVAQELLISFTKGKNSKAG
jgi:deoxyribonucleoside regulator